MVVKEKKEKKKKKELEENIDELGQELGRLFPEGMTPPKP